ncbi:helix-turn-helix domain-containing protein [Flavobacterium rhizosphaerae]|uniref:Helix-turn-helix domain-containing protein n=1 Tax=Flavobacterium rhizosphaerae TaxID=3163298 RepID=A0ABW8YXQ7_9FLAO
MSQDKTTSEKYSLYSKSYSYLDQKIEESSDLNAALPYLRAYLVKAQNEQNGAEIVNGYKNLLHASPESQRLIYADSMVLAATRANDNELIGAAYLTKGIVYFSRKQHIKALDHYLLANRYLISSKDPYLKNKVKYNIANIKYYLGFYSEAIVLYTECEAFFRNENPTAYISCLHSLGLCHNRMGDYTQSNIINKFALEESQRLGTPDMIPYIMLSQGINQYFLKQYPESVKQISATLKAIIEDGDFANESVAYFYLGKNYMALKEKATAINYFKKVDNIFDKKGYLRPDLRESYEILIKDNRKHNIQGELYYINRLLKADSILNTNYKNLSEKIHKEYDTVELLRAKNAVEKQLSDKKLGERLFIFLFLVLFLIILFLSYRYYRVREKYKKRFEKLLRDVEPENITVNAARPSAPTLDPLNLKEEVIESILENLAKFEQKHGYLQKDLTVGKVAEAFGTNGKYLSKVIMAYKGKKFINYINDLKIDHIVTLLKTERKYRRYTNKALAEEAGFSTTQHFTTAFVKKALITPTFFITELNKVYINDE